MTGVLIRLVLLAVVGGGAWLIAGWWQRRRGAGRIAIPPGLTLVTGPGCALCGPVQRALARAGVEPRLAEVDSFELPGPQIRSLPVALLVDASGTVVMRRSGRAALDDAGALAKGALNLQQELDGSRRSTPA